MRAGRSLTWYPIGDSLMPDDLPALLPPTRRPHHSSPVPESQDNLILSMPRHPAATPALEPAQGRGQQGRTYGQERPLRGWTRRDSLEPNRLGHRQVGAHFACRPGGSPMPAPAASGAPGSPPRLSPSDPSLYRGAMISRPVPRPRPRPCPESACPGYGVVRGRRPCISLAYESRRLQPG